MIKPEKNKDGIQYFSFSTMDKRFPDCFVNPQIMFSFYEQQEKITYIVLAIQWKNCFECTIVMIRIIKAQDNLSLLFSTHGHQHTHTYTHNVQWKRKIDHYIYLAYGIMQYYPKYRYENRYFYKYSSIEIASDNFWLICAKVFWIFNIVKVRYIKLY